MPDYINHWLSYTGEGQAPWVGCDRYGVMPNKLRISEGITYIGENAFESFGCLKEIVLPQSLQKIGKEAFFDCFHVEIINLPHHVSKRHPQMSLWNRAAQFAPFAALTGYEESIKEETNSYTSSATYQ